MTEEHKLLLEQAWQIGYLIGMLENAAFYLEKWDQADREFVACKIRKKLQGMGMNRYDKEDSDDD